MASNTPVWPFAGEHKGKLITEVPKFVIVKEYRQRDFIPPDVKLWIEANWDSLQVTN